MNRVCKSANIRGTMIVEILTLFCMSANVIGNFENDTLDWWQTSVIYQIHTRSFKDSNSDGIGDLKGIEEKAEYLKDLGIGAVWLNPIYESPMADMGYDISNFKSIHPIFGTMDDFESLRDKLHSLNIKLIIDFVPNHSSDEHEWFLKSINRIDPYTDYYVWKDPKGWINETTPIPPNNWISGFEEPMWTYNQKRKQFYLHQFTFKQPDLNYHSKQLVEEIHNTLRFWLDKGVDGFRMDAIAHLIEDERYLDLPVISNETVNGNVAFSAFDPIYTKDNPKNYEIAKQFHDILKSYAERDGKTRVMMPETRSSIVDTIKWYGTQSQPIAQLPLNFFLTLNLNVNSNAFEFQNMINIWLKNMPKGMWPNWSFGNHDVPRISETFDSNSIDAINIMLLLLPGTPFTYNGEEIGMEDTNIRWDQTIDKRALNVGPQLYGSFSRDPSRTPFQWDNSRHGGFSDTNGSTWLPVNPNYYRINVHSQKHDPRSHYNIYKSLVKLRSNDVFRSGNFKSYVVSKWIFTFKRYLQNQIYVIVMNLNNQDEFVNLKNVLPRQNFIVIMASVNSEYIIGDKLSSSNDPFNMRPKSAIVLQVISL